jgi:DNA primase
MVDSLLVCEGPTDCAALLTLGYDVIARASCTEGAAMLKELLKLDRKDIIIMGDADEPKIQADGTVLRPGQDGAKRLALDLQRAARSVRVVFPHDGKDIREWLRNGATRYAVDRAIENARII